MSRAPASFLTSHPLHSMTPHPENENPIRIKAGDHPDYQRARRERLVEQMLELAESRAALEEASDLLSVVFGPTSKQKEEARALSAAISRIPPQ